MVVILETSGYMDQNQNHWQVAIQNPIEPLEDQLWCDPQLTYPISVHINTAAY